MKNDIIHIQRVAFTGVSPVEATRFLLEGDDFLFKAGDYVVYKRDVCQIKRTKTISDREYYVLHPIDDETLTINVPIDNPLGYLRPVISKKEAEKLIASISKIPLIETADRMIENQYKILLHSGKLEDLVRIIKTSYLRNDERKKNGKKIGEIDDNYFHLAERILYNELSISLGKCYADTENYVVETVQKSSEK